jgi:hypothetical protein
MRENSLRRNVVFDAMVFIAIALANVYVCRELFAMEYTRHMGSIEAAYIGISRYAMLHWRDLTWFPLWYNGIPYQNTYPPLLHWAVAFVAWARGITPAHAHHWVTALMYCLGPGTVFVLVRALSGSRWAGFAAGWMYTALSPSAWLISKVLNDLGSPFRPRRLHALVMYGEGPHVSAMTLLPLAILMVHLAVRKKTAPWVFAAAASLAAVVLTNWIAGFALALGVAAYVLAGFESLRWRGFLLLLAIGAGGYALAMPWAPPSTILVTRFNAQQVGDFRTVYQALPGWLLAMTCCLAVLKFGARRLSMELQFGLYFAFLTSLITLNDAWFHIAIIPQPDRYHLEMEMALIILVALVGHKIFQHASRRTVILTVVLLVVALIQPLRISRRYSRWVITPIEITQTSEWKTAYWLDKNWSGERVMLPGSTMFWLAAFSDTPQLGGGYDQGRTDDMINIASFGLTWGMGGDWPEWSVLWLKALGVQAVGVSGPGSTETFKPYRDPNKYEGVLEPLWRDGGDALYRVGTPHASLARVIPRTALVPRPPINGADVDPLRKYVNALDDLRMPPAAFSWTSQHSAQIVTDIGSWQVISMQMAWHKGWHASQNGKAVPIVRDALGMMTIDPRQSGPITIYLNYDGGLEMRFAHWASGLAFFILLIGPFAARGILKESW